MERDRINRQFLGAIREGVLDEVKWYVEKEGADVNYSLARRNFILPLNEAVKFQRMEIVKYLLKKGAKLNTNEGLYMHIVDNEYYDSIEFLRKNDPDFERWFGAQLARAILLDNSDKMIKMIFKYSSHEDINRGFADAVPSGKENIIDLLVNEVDSKAIKEAVIEALLRRRTKGVEYLLDQNLINDIMLVKLIPEIISSGNVYLLERAIEYREIELSQKDVDKAIALKKRTTKEMVIYLKNLGFSLGQDFYADLLEEYLEDTTEEDIEGMLFLIENRFLSRDVINDNLYKIVHHQAVVRKLKRKGFKPDPEKLRYAISDFEEEEDEEILRTLREVGWI